MGLPYERTFVGRFASAFPDIDVLNAGVSSYAPSVYFMKIKSLLDAGLQFDEVVVYVDISDVQDEAIYYRYGPDGDFELGNFEEALPNFNGMLFDAIMCSHFIEHISDPIRALQFISTRLKPGGSVYLEWPHPMSKNMPSLTKLHDIGVNVMTTNFYDDLTHKEAWTMDHIASGLESKGLRISACGRVWFDFIADELMAHGKAANNAIDLTYAVWYKFAWAQFVVASKPL